MPVFWWHPEMVSLGRNQPCHCGSGKKYKRCHLDSDRSALHSAVAKPLLTHRDLLTARLLHLRATATDFGERAYAPAAAVHDVVIARIGDGLKDQAAAECLSTYLVELEQAIQVLAAKHSRYFWLHLARRLPPEPIGDSSQWAMMLYRRILTLAILKHGSATPEDFVTLPDGETTSIMPATITEADMVDVYALEYLAHEYNTAAAAYRRVGKGAKLVVINDDFRAVAESETQALMKLLDARVARYGSVSSPFGASIPDELPSESVDEHPFAALGLWPNTSRDMCEAFFAPRGVRFPDPPNFMPGLLPIARFRPFLTGFDEEMLAAMGTTTDVLLACICGISMHLIARTEAAPQLVAQMYSTGYLPFTRGEPWEGFRKNVADWVMTWWSRVRDEQIEHDAALETIQRGFAALTYRSEDFTQISLWERTPFRLFIEQDDRVLLDLAAMTDCLSDLFRAVGFNATDPGSIKGKTFEAEVIRQATEAGFVTWECGRILKLDDDTVREIDASFVVGTTLFVVECKARSQNARVERGEYAAVKARWETLRDKHLGQAETLKNFLEANRTGRNFEIPDSVTTIEHCVCTPAAEWIPSRDPALWFTDEIPRICTPDELIQILSDADQVQRT